jgi:hypothetical protein
VPVSDIDALKLFNEKVEKIRQRGYMKYIGEGGRIAWAGSFGSGGRAESKAIGPDADQVESLLLTMRFFGQNNEPMSIKNVADAYSRLSLSSWIRDQFDMIRADLNVMLDLPTQIAWKGHPVTHGDVYYTFLYGEHAHSNPDKQALYKEWQKSEIFGAFEFTFHATLVNYLHKVFWIEKTNKLALEELGRGTPLTKGRSRGP